MADNDVEIRVRVRDQTQAGFRDVNGRLRNMRGQFAAEGDAAGRGFGQRFSAGIAGSLSGFGSRVFSIIKTGAKDAALGVAALGATGGAIQGIVGLAAAAQQLAGIALALPGALAAGASAIAAFKVGVSGVSAALTAKAPTGGGGGGGNAAATQIQNAKAIRSAQDQIASSARGVASAQKAVEQASRGVASAQRGVVDAEHAAEAASRSYNDALKAEKTAQADVARARADAARQLQDAAEAASDALLGQEGASIRLKRAEEKLTAVQRDTKASYLDLEEAQYDVKVAQDGVTDASVTAQRATEDNTSAQAKGVDGADQVVAANDALANAHQNVADAAYAVTQANQGLADAQQGVIDATDQLAAAQQGVIDAQHQADEAVQNLADTIALQNAKATQAVGGTNAYADALAKLSPNARAFVEAIRGLAPAWKSVKDAVQDRLFAGLAADVGALAGTYFPVLRQGLGDIAAGYNAMAREGVKALLAPSAVAAVNAVLRDTSSTVANMRPVLSDVISGFLGMAQIGSSYLPAVGTAAAEVGAKFKTWVADNPEKIRALIDGAIAGFKDLFAIVGNVGSIIGSVFSGLAQGSGQTFLATLRDSTAALAAFMSSAAAQGPLQALGETMRVCGTVLKQVLLAALTALGPIITAVAPVFQQFAILLGGAVVQAIQILAPVLPVLINAFLQLLSALTPIIPIIAQLVATLIPPLAALIQQLAPLIVPLISAFAQLLSAALVPLMPVLGQLVQQLLPVLTKIIQSLVPVMGPLIDAFGAILQAIMPIIVECLPPLIDLLAQLLIPILKATAAIFRDVVAPAVKWVADTLGSFLRSARDAVKGAVDQFTWMESVVNAKFGGIKGVLASVWDGLKNGAKTAVNGAIFILNGLILGVNKVVQGLNMVNPFGQIGYVPYIPYLAKGGNGSGLAMVGEQGRELVQLPTGSRVLPHGDTEREMAKMGGSGSGGAGLQVVFGGNVDGAFATAFMQLVRSGQIQIQAA